MLSLHNHLATSNHETLLKYRADLMQRLDSALKVWGQEARTLRGQLDQFCDSIQDGDLSEPFFTKLKDALLKKDNVATVNILEILRYITGKFKGYDGQVMELISLAISLNDREDILSEATFQYLDLVERNDLPRWEFFQDVRRLLANADPNIEEFFKQVKLDYLQSPFLFDLLNRALNKPKTSHDWYRQKNNALAMLRYLAVEGPLKCRIAAVETAMKSLHDFTDEQFGIFYQIVKATYQNKFDNVHPLVSILYSMHGNGLHSTIQRSLWLRFFCLFIELRIDRVGFKYGLLENIRSYATKLASELLSTNDSKSVQVAIEYWQSLLEHGYREQWAQHYQRILAACETDRETFPNVRNLRFDLLEKLLSVLYIPIEDRKTYGNDFGKLVQHYREQIAKHPLFKS